MSKQRTGWFLHLGGPRGADGKRDFHRQPDGRRTVFNDAEAKAVGEEARASGHPNAHLRPAYGPMPTPNPFPTVIEAVQDDGSVTPCVLDQSGGIDQVVDPATIPLDPSQVPDDMYDRFNAAQRRHWSRLQVLAPADWTPYPA